VPAGHGGAGGADLDQAIGMLRSRVDEEFKITERLDSKSRQSFALASVFFAAVQTVAFGSFAQSTVNGTEKVLLLIAVVAAGAALVIVAHRLTNGEELLEEADVRPESIEQWCNEAAGDPDYVKVRLVRDLRRMARRRSENNEIRARNYDAVVVATRWALIAAAVELLAGIAVRL
jgi:hypothetical protein